MGVGGWLTCLETESSLDAFSEPLLYRGNLSSSLGLGLYINTLSCLSTPPSRPPPSSRLPLLLRPSLASLSSPCSMSEDISSGVYVSRKSMSRSVGVAKSVFTTECMCGRGVGGYALAKQLYSNTYKNHVTNLAVHTLTKKS